MFYTMMTIPAATSTIASIGAYSNPWFVEMLNYIWFPVGVALAVYVVLMFYNLLTGWFQKRNRIRAGWEEDDVYNSIYGKK